MPFYMIRASYSSSATDNLIHHPQHREDALRKACEALGGKLHAFFFSFGEYDMMLLVKCPTTLRRRPFRFPLKPPAPCGNRDHGAADRRRGSRGHEEGAEVQVRAADMTGGTLP